MKLSGFLCYIQNISNLWWFFFKYAIQYRLACWISIIDHNLLTIIKLTTVNNTISVQKSLDFRALWYYLSISRFAILRLGDLWWSMISCYNSIESQHQQKFECLEIGFSWRTPCSPFLGRPIAHWIGLSFEATIFFMNIIGLRVIKENNRIQNSVKI